MNYVRDILEMVDDNELVYAIFVDTGVRGTVVPKHLNGLQRFDLGVGLPKPTRIDLCDEALEVTLSFGGAPYACVFPWGGVLGIAFPPNYTAQITFHGMPDAETKGSAPPPPPSPAKGKLRLV